jgi:PAS domain-containing protein
VPSSATSGSGSNAATDLADLGTTLRLRATLLDALGEAVIATDPERRIRYWNRFAERLYGGRAGSTFTLVLPRGAGSG